MWTILANPHRFMGFSKTAIPIAIGLGVLLAGWSLYQGLWVVPPVPDQGGDVARIMFVHVPSAWLSMGLYAGLAGASFVWFIWRHELADVAARAIAPIGAGYTVLCFSTGAIWGEPTWGPAWRNVILYDSRLMSVLVLLFLFLGYMALRAALDTRQKAARAGAILAMVGDYQPAHHKVLRRSLERVDHSSRLQRYSYRRGGCRERWHPPGLFGPSDDWLFGAAFICIRAHHAADAGGDF